MKKIGVIQFPGSNCERETKLAIERSGMQAISFLWNYKTVSFDIFDGFVIVGGFSYEDRCRSGLIASKDPLLSKLIIEIEKGKPVLGICNGAQILIESGIVPGIKIQDSYKLSVALTLNEKINKKGKILGIGFYNTWCYIDIKNQKNIAENAFFQKKFSKPIRIPFANAEGRFILKKSTFNLLKSSGVMVWKYVNSIGNIKRYYPINPNQSMENIAAISNFSGNVLAMMPHPERTTDGDIIFASIRTYLEKKKIFLYKTFKEKKKIKQLKNYTLPESRYQFLIKMIITDNESISIEQTLKNLGIYCTIQKYQHLEIFSKKIDYKKMYELLYNNHAFYNPKKEYLITKIKLLKKSIKILVRKNTVFNQYKLNILHKKYSLNEIFDIKYGIFWNIIPKNYQEIDYIKKYLLHNSILYNPIAYKAYFYEE